MDGSRRRIEHLAGARMVDLGAGRLDYRYPNAKPKTKIDGFEDASAICGPGIIVLVNEGRVVHIAKAKSMAMTIAKHREFVGKSMPSWFPLKGIVFDEVFWKTSHPDRIDAEVESLRRIYMRQEEALEVA